MGRLVYSALCSLDGFTTDRDGDFGWAEPDAEVHAFVNDRERRIGTYLYGRRMYETMRVWQDDVTTWEPSPSPEVVEYAEVWRDADKAVFSTTLPESEVTTPRTTLYRTLDVDAVSAMKELSDVDLSAGGPTFAAHLLRAGLVDEIALYLAPVVVGGGLAVLPDDVRLDLTLREERSFGNGTVFLRYDVG
ncbi:dihydrofolate reductase family protein [Jatrophihabitans sp. YIM 134969]